MEKAKRFLLIFFDILLVFWAYFCITLGLDEISGTPFRTYESLLILSAILVGSLFILLKIKFKVHSFKIFNLWIVYFVLLWLAFEFIVFSFYQIAPSERIPRLIKSITFEGLINFFYPFPILYLFYFLVNIVSSLKKRFPIPNAK